MNTALETPPQESLEAELEVAGFDTYATHQKDVEVSDALIRQLVQALDPKGRLTRWPEAFPVDKVEAFVGADAFQAEINTRARLLWRYRCLGFSGVIGTLTETAQPLDTVGNHSAAYPLDYLDTQFAVRFPIDNPVGERRVATSRYAHDLWPGTIGVSHLEQLVTYDLVDGVTVSLRGPERFSRHPDDMDCIPDVHLNELREAIFALYGMQRRTDMDRKDVLYGAEEGFVLIDYVETDGTEKLSECLYGPIGLFFPQSLYYAVGQSSGDAAFDTLVSQSMVSAANLAERYIRICEANHPDSKLSERTRWAIGNAKAIHLARLAL